MTCFWQFRPAKSTRKRAEWAGDVDLETVQCPLDQGHQHPGRRFGALNLILPDKEPDDIVWTWLGDCLVTETTLSLFRKHQFTGFEVQPAQARFNSIVEKPPRLWELIVTGWGGLAPQESGIHLAQEQSCSVCGHLVYTGLVEPNKLIDAALWDGSDVFIVWPLPKFRFITERVRDLVLEHNLSGVRIEDATVFDTDMDEFSPGRLSYSMPEDRARELGEPLGIY